MNKYICKACGFVLVVRDVDGSWSGEDCPRHGACDGEMRTANQYDGVKPHILAEMLDELEKRTRQLEELAKC